jgi:hypothetical protein
VADCSLLPNARDCRDFLAGFVAFEAPDLAFELLLRLEPLLFVPAARDFDRVELDLPLVEAVFERLELAAGLRDFALARPPAAEDFFLPPVFELLLLPLLALMVDPPLLPALRPRAGLRPIPASRCIMPGSPEANPVLSLPTIFLLCPLSDPLLRAIAYLLRSLAQSTETPEAWPEFR